MMKTLNPGQLVRCNYRKSWKGVVLGISEWGTYKGKQYPIYLVQPTVDSKNNVMPKHVKPRRYAGHWLQPIKSINSAIDYRSWPVVKFYDQSFDRH